MTQETFPMIVGGEETLNERTLLTQVVLPLQYD